MVFSDLFFLFVFIPTFVVLYLLAAWVQRIYPDTFLARDNFSKNLVLVVFSLLFYAWGEPVYVLLLLFCVLANYLCGLWLGRALKCGKGKRAALVTGVAVNLGILMSFKYLNFVADSLGAIGLHVSVPNILLPIGISFYIFQSISYQVDVYRGETPVQKNFWHLLLYISMFPQLIAGPIVRYGTIAHEISERHVTSQDVSDGIYRFLIGLAKKVIIANQLGEIVKLVMDTGFDNLSTSGAWLGAVAFTLQLYFDFSGYSDMAIGIGRCLGFHFCENFDHPYCSRTITEFWRRWHMSLGSFFRDYVYIPMGGNRRRQLLNILTVWFLTGLWHGASWNFVLWGLYFGVILLIEKYTIYRIRDRIPSPLLHFYTLLIVVLGMGTLFYFDDLGQIGHFWTVMFGFGGELTDFASSNIFFEKFWLLLAAVLLSTPLRKDVDDAARRWLPQSGAVDVYGHAGAVGRVGVSCIIIILCVALLVGATNNAFLYTRF